MSRFWELYAEAKPHIASAADDIRHKVVEEAWFGRRVTGDIGENNAPEGQKTASTSAHQEFNIDNSTHATNSVTQHNHHSLYSSVWGKEPEGSQVYGQGPTPAAPDNQHQQQQGRGLEQEL
jgi:hypothetical protein